MAQGDFQPLQKHLIACQGILDDARMEGWSEERRERFLNAARDLHEEAVMLSRSHGAPTELPPTEEQEPAPANRLIPKEPSEEEDTQVDLISSIGELTLAEKLALQPLGNVAEGLSILERAQFTSVLFSGEEQTFSTLLERLGRAATQEEALAIFQESLHPQGESDEVESLKEEFAKRIMRTFVS